MNVKRILGFVLLLGGVGLMIFSSYVTKQVEEGKMKISSAQQKVNQGSSLFSLNPVTKEIGKGIFGSAQGKIEEGQQEVNYYTQLADRCQIGGIALIVIGAGFIIFSRKKSKK